MTQRGKIVWRPSVEKAKDTRIRDFSKFEEFSDVHQWSVDKPDEFWARIWEF